MVKKTKDCIDDRTLMQSGAVTDAAQVVAEDTRAVIGVAHQSAASRRADLSLHSECQVGLLGE